jgi:hypothetical protein
MRPSVSNSAMTPPALGVDEPGEVVRRLLDPLFILVPVAGVQPFVDERFEFVAFRLILPDSDLFTLG